MDIINMREFTPNRENQRDILTTKYRNNVRERENSFIYYNKSAK